ncbi:hypothetical protein Y1Q_0001397 [Alligator mississippiensis]|uniref:Uncharacterized protein n=1 Tax=Alligator mississippiensis TaxID=8496 RepID=A0A151M9B8_ALLMI|nr:hypothetical protein Y1Q_0001397 [Alligator mississippiensis]
MQVRVAITQQFFSQDPLTTETQPCMDLRVSAARAASSPPGWDRELQDLRDVCHKKPRITRCQTSMSVTEPADLFYMLSQFGKIREKPNWI